MASRFNSSCASAQNLIQNALEGEFDSLSAQLVSTAIENLVLKDDDASRSLRERRAEALVTLAQIGLDSGRAGHAQRPHIVVTMTIDDFEHRTGQSARSADGTPVARSRSVGFVL